jgi:hypothetical protein
MFRTPAGCEKIQSRDLVVISTREVGWVEVGEYLAAEPVGIE